MAGKRYCNDCKKPTSKGSGARGLCSTCYHRAQNQGRLPRKGTPYLTEPPEQDRARSTLEPYRPEDDEIDFEDPTREQDVDLEAVIYVLGLVQTASPFSRKLLDGCIIEIERLTNMAPDPERD